MNYEEIDKKGHAGPKKKEKYNKSGNTFEKSYEQDDPWQTRFYGETEEY